MSVHLPFVFNPTPPSELGPIAAIKQPPLGGLIIQQRAPDSIPAEAGEMCDSLRQVRIANMKKNYWKIPFDPFTEPNSIWWVVYE